MGGILASAALSLGATAAQAAFVVVILLRNPRGNASRAFLILMAAHILWTSGEALARLYPEAPAATLGLWLRIQWTGLSLLPGGVLYFALNFPYQSPLLRRPWAHVGVFLPSMVFIGLVWSGDLLVRGIVQTPLGPDAATGPVYTYAVTIVVLWLVLADVRVGRIWYRLRGQPTGAAAGIVFVGFAVNHALGIGTDALLPVVTGSNVRTGLASIYLLSLAAFVAYATYRYRVLVLEPEREVTPPPAPALPLKEGLSHLILCTDKAPAYAGFRALASRVPALCITATPPTVVARRYGLDRTPILWLTKVDGHATSLKPAELKFEVLQSLGNALHQSPTMAILLDDLDYLAVAVGFQETVGFLKGLYDRASRGGSTLVVPVHPGSLEPRQVALLGQLFDRSEDLRYRVDLPSVDGSSSILAVGSRAWAWNIFEGQGGAGRGLVVTSLHPSKYRAIVGAAVPEILWLSEDSEAGGIKPTDLDVGLQRTVRRWMQEHPRTPVLLEGLEYLATVNKAPEVVDLVKGLVDSASTADSTVVFAVRGEALEPRLLTLLALRCEAVLHEGEKGKLH